MAASDSTIWKAQWGNLLVKGGSMEFAGKVFFAGFSDCS